MVQFGNTPMLLFFTCNNKLHLGHSWIYILCSKMYLSNDLRFCDCVTNRLKRHKCAFIHHYVNGYFLWIKTFCQSHCCGLNTKFMVLQHIFLQQFLSFQPFSKYILQFHFLCWCTMTKRRRSAKNPEAQFGVYEHDGHLQK